MYPSLGRSGATDGPPSPLDVGLSFAKRPMSDFEVGLSLASRPMLDLEVGLSLAGRPMLDFDVGLSLASRPMLDLEVGLSLASRPMLDLEVGLSLAGRPMLDFDVGLSLASRPMLDLEVGLLHRLGWATRRRPSLLDKHQGAPVDVALTMRGMTPSLEKTVRVSALLAVAMCLGMLAIFLTTGIGQDPLQYVHPPAEYARLLLADPPALRASIALDNFFLSFYAVVFASLGALLWRGGTNRPLLAVSLAALAALTLLDMVENFHFMVMLARAEAGMPPSDAEIAVQAFESLLKFHIGYLGLFLLGFAIPRTRASLRVLAALQSVQLAIGILLFVVPRSVAVPLVFARLVYFITALLLVAWAFGPKRRAAGSDVPASPPDTMLRAAG